LCRSAASATATPSAPALSATLGVLAGLVRLRGRSLGGGLHRFDFDGRFLYLPALLATAIWPLWPILPVGPILLVLLVTLRAIESGGVAHFLDRLIAARDRGPFDLFAVFLVFKFQEVCDIEERVALQPEVNECGLHAGKHARYAAVVNGASEGVLVFAFVIDFSELVVFQDREPRLMRRRGNTNLFCHLAFPPGENLPGHAARSAERSRIRKGGG